MCRYDAHDDDGLVVQIECAPDDVRIPSEAAAPQGLVDDTDVAAAIRNDVLGGERTTHERRDAHDVEEVSIDHQDAVELVHLVTRNERDGLIDVAGQSSDGSGVVARRSGIGRPISRLTCLPWR